MSYKSYMHIERFGNDEVDGIEIGDCYIFPKIDGTNSSVWLDEVYAPEVSVLFNAIIGKEGKTYKLCAGSRKRELTLEADNANFYSDIMKDQNIIDFLKEYWMLRLYGEWLVPHSLKTYRKETWRKFYVFDIEDIESNKLLTYEQYKPILDMYAIDYIPCQAIIKNPTYENLLRECENNTFLIEDGKGVGEGIVLKNYEYKNKYDRQIWAKIVTNEFKEKHVKEMRTKKIQGTKMIEDEIVEKYLTEEMIEKTFQKILNDIDDKWSSKMIPRLLHTVWHDFIIEEIWDIIKKFKNPKIDFKTLQTFANMKVKQVKDNLF